jgi:hypothetical protein
LALGGRRFISINNNQMEDGVGVKGYVGEEARLGRNVWGGWLPVIWGGILIDKKNREMGGPFALDGCRLMEGHHNQPKFGIDDARGIEEESRPGRNVWGGVVSSLDAANRQRKKMTTKICCGLRQPPTNENHTTTNQKHSGATKEVKEGSCDWQKSHNNQPKARWRNEGGEGEELRPARGARGKRESIVWGQSSWVVY